MPERMMRAFLREDKPSGLVDAARGDEDVVGPQRDLGVAEFTCTPYARIDQLAPDPEAARVRLDIEQPELARCGIVALRQEHRADDRAVSLGDPGVFLPVVEMGDEFGENFADQPLEGPVPAVFPGVQEHLAVRDEAEIAGRGLAKSNAAVERSLSAENGPDLAHGGDETRAGVRFDLAENRFYLVPRAPIERREGCSSRIRQEEQPPFCVFRARARSYIISPDKSGEDTTDLRLIHSERAG